MLRLLITLTHLTLTVGVPFRIARSPDGLPLTEITSRTLLSYEYTRFKHSFVGKTSRNWFFRTPRVSCVMIIFLRHSIQGRPARWITVHGTLATTRALLGLYGETMKWGEKKALGPFRGKSCVQKCSCDPKKSEIEKVPVFLLVRGYISRQNFRSVETQKLCKTLRSWY